jgi:DNA end-binding protein Ku
MRAVWTGSISFGLVSVAVRLYPAVRRRDVRFHELDRETGARIRHRRVRSALVPTGPAPEQPTKAPADLPLPTAADRVGQRRATPDLDEVEIAPEAIVRGFEVEPGRYVTVEKEELEALSSEPTHRIDIDQFVKLDEIDSLYFDVTYHAVPDRDQDRPFALLREAMATTRSGALGWFVLRRLRHFALVQPRGELMTVTTLHYADELLQPARRSPIVEPALSERELEVARLLIETLRGPFEPERYRDERRQSIMELIERRRGSAREAPVDESIGTGVQDLMRALEASLKQARELRRKHTA